MRPGTTVRLAQVMTLWFLGSPLRRGKARRRPWSKLRAVAPTIDDTEDLDRFLGDLVDDDVEVVDDDLTCPWLTTLVPGERMSS